MIRIVFGSIWAARARNSVPVMPGIRWSEITTATGWVLMISRPASPLVAVTMENSRRNVSSKMRRFSGSSST